MVDLNKLVDGTSLSEQAKAILLGYWEANSIKSLLALLNDSSPIVTEAKVVGEGFEIDLTQEKPILLLHIIIEREGDVDLIRLIDELQSLSIFEIKIHLIVRANNKEGVETQFEGAFKVGETQGKDVHSYLRGWSNGVKALLSTL